MGEKEGDGIGGAEIRHAAIGRVVRRASAVACCLRLLSLSSKALPRDGSCVVLVWGLRDGEADTWWFQFFMTWQRALR